MKIGSNKATGIDAIGSKALKLALPAIVPSLTHIYNAGIITGNFPKKVQASQIMSYLQER